MFNQVDTTCRHIEMEHNILDFWDKIQAFDKLRQKNKGKAHWSFLDGPITANNPMGVHHAWGRSLKDCYQRYHAMLGHDMRWQNGFDCQGLWVEVEVEKEMGLATKAEIEKTGLEEFINRCKARVAKYSKIQTEQSIRLGYWMDWDNSYYTISDENNYTIWSFLKKCHNRKLIYKGMDAMPWCPRCETGISEQERREGYKNVEDTAVYVAFPLVGRDNEYLLVWTTTPWTLAANVAAAVNPKITYAQVRQDGKLYYISESLVSVMKEKGPYTVEATLPGKDMVGWEYTGPFDELDIVQRTFSEAGYTHRVIGWDDVADSEGVGIVHIAPGCGKEDFDLGKEHKLPLLMPIDETGTYVGGYGFLQGKKASEVADEVLLKLREKGLYYKKERYSHDYPHCWRCGTPLLFRSVDEWYIDMSWRDEIKKIVKQIRWIPEWGKEQELNWLDNMHDWMISKKRFWGLALPIFECECGWFDVIGSKEELKERAIAGWDEFEGNSPHRPWIDKIRIKCQKCGKPVARITDVGNPWLDAGIVPYSTTKYNTDREYWKKWIPADLVLECFPGQFRNWFYALLSMSTMMEGIAPFKTLLGHALVRDEQGKEMHKSTGNAIWFDDAAEKMGADVMRWMYCRQNPVNNLNFGFNKGQQISRRVFGTWWNVYGFFVNYARLDGFDPNDKPVPYDELQDIDRWLLSKLQELIRVANDALNDYNVMLLVQAAEDFIERLSNWYVRRNRRRYWRPKNASDTDKLAAYQTLYKVLATLCKLLAPVTPFITEEMYQNLVRNCNPDAPESVHHCDYPQFDASLHNEQLSAEMDMVADIVSRVLSIRETHQIRVRQPLSRLMVVAGNTGSNGDSTGGSNDSNIAIGDIREMLNRYQSHILDELNIKQLEVVDSLDEYISYTIKPNRKTLGPKFGKDMASITTLLTSQPAEIFAKTIAAGQNVTLTDDNGNTWELLPDDIIVERSFPESIVVNDNAQPILALDVKITPELHLEGLSRDIVRHIQQTRKDAGLQIQDHIAICYHSSDELLNQAFERHRDYICRETLCDTMQISTGKDMTSCTGANGATVRDSYDDASAVREIKIGSAVLKLVIKKADGKYSQPS